MHPDLQALNAPGLDWENITCAHMLPNVLIFCFLSHECIKHSAAAFSKFPSRLSCILSGEGWVSQEKVEMEKLWLQQQSRVSYLKQAWGQMMRREVFIRWEGKQKKVLRHSYCVECPLDQPSSSPLCTFHQHPDSAEETGATILKTLATFAAQYATMLYLQASRNFTVLWLAICKNSFLKHFDPS